MITLCEKYLFEENGLYFTSIKIEGSISWTVKYSFNNILSEYFHDTDIKMFLYEFAKKTEYDYNSSRVLIGFSDETIRMEFSLRYCS